MNPDNFKSLSDNPYAIVRMFQDLLNAGMLIETGDRLLTELEAAHTSELMAEVRSILNVWMMINHPKRKFIYHF